MKHIYFIVLSCFWFWSTASADEIEIIEVTQTPPEPTKPSPPGGIVRSPSNPGAGSTPIYELPPEDSVEARIECYNAKLKAKKRLNRCIATVADNKALANKYCEGEEEESFLDTINVEVSFGFKAWKGSLTAGLKPELKYEKCIRQLDLNADAAEKWCVAGESDMIADACTQ